MQSNLLLLISYLLVGVPSILYLFAAPTLQNKAVYEILLLLTSTYSITGIFTAVTNNILWSTVEHLAESLIPLVALPILGGQLLYNARLLQMGGSIGLALVGAAFGMVTRLSQYQNTQHERRRASVHQTDAASLVAIAYGVPIICVSAASGRFWPTASVLLYGMAVVLKGARRHIILHNTFLGAFLYGSVEYLSFK